MSNFSFMTHLELEGAFICPEGASTVAAARALLAQGFLKPSDRVVLLNTGCGLKYPNITRTELPVLEIGQELVL